MSAPIELPTLYVDTRESTRPHPYDDSRTTGTDMLKLCSDYPGAPHCEAATLHAGDFCFSGNGPSDNPCMVGVERKRLYDMLTSIRSGRFSGEQLPKLLSRYEHVTLVLEGTDTWRTNYSSGLLETRRGRDWVPVAIGKQNFLGLELESFLNDIATLTPVKVVRTRDPKDTVCYVMGLMHSFSKPWDKRHHHVAIHQHQEYATLGKASTVRRVSFQMEKVGWEKSSEIDQAFPSVAAMCGMAPSHECVCPVCKEAKIAARVKYSKLPGFGKVMSARVWNQLHGQYEVERIIE